MPRVLATTACVLSVLFAGCTSGADRPQSGSSRSPSSTASTADTPSPTGPPTPSASESPSESLSPSEPLAEPDAEAAMVVVRELAALGPREATSGAFRRAAALVEDRLAAMGYEVSRDEFAVPAGESWGVPVGAGRTLNLVARLPDASASSAGEEVVVGAHLDTVPQAPGAEDNASGVAVVLELARLAAASGTGRPVTFVLFGAEEPRGRADDEHHFGSQAYVRHVDRGNEPAPAAMVSLDRVGAPGPVPVCTGGLSPRRVQRELRAVAEQLDIPSRGCENRTSDHWPFEKAGHTVARLGGNDSPGYHSARDLPRTVSSRQLDRVTRVMWEWLR